MRVSLPENIVGRRAVLHFRRCHALAGAADERHASLLRKSRSPILSAMAISFVNKYMPSWVASEEKQLAGDILTFGCHGLFLIGKTWEDRIPPLVTRAANAYLSVAALFYLDYSFRILTDRIHLTRLCIKLGNWKVASYACLDAANCALSIILSIGYTIAAFMPKARTATIYQRLKSIGMISIVIGVVCALWTRWLVAKTTHTLSSYPPDRAENIRLINAWLNRTNIAPSPLQ